MSQPLIDALRQALAKDPDNAPLWQHLADQLAAAGARDEAIEAYQRALGLLPAELEPLRRLLPLLRAAGRHAEALLRAEQALATRDDPALRVELAHALLARGDREEAARQYRRAKQAGGAAPELDALLAATPAAGEPALASVTGESISDADWAAQFDWGDLRVTLQDVAGLDAVKRQIRLRILAPQQNPATYRAFGRRAGGGILLYGPPGCGKTFVARATAGELGARFVSVGIHEIVDKYWGESEKLIHALFEQARRRAPAVLFFDEFDALGSPRGRSESQFWKTLVNQFLQEMDGFHGRTENLLVFAATNMPWNVDSAFRRPGRFDRLLFVPPPDAAARVEILRRHAERLPGAAALDVAAIGRRTELFTGADLTALCERAAEHALERSLADGVVHSVTTADFDRELKAMQSSALEWLATARNHARYANESGIYDELTDYLKSIKRW